MAIGTINNDTWKIWFEYYQNSEVVSAGVCVLSYAHKSSAVRRARQLYGDNQNVKWYVSQTNPLKKMKGNFIYGTYGNECL